MHQHQRHPRSVRRSGVILIVADHRGALRSAAELGDQAEQMTRIGLPDGEMVAASDPIEQRQQREPPQDGECRALGLVAAHRGAVAAPA